MPRVCAGERTSSQQLVFRPVHFLTVPLLLGLYSFLSFKLHKIYVTFTTLILSVQFSGLNVVV